MAAAERIERGYLGRILQLTLLAPDIVEAILDGREPDDLAVPQLLERFVLVLERLLQACVMAVFWGLGHGAIGGPAGARAGGA